MSQARSNDQSIDAIRTRYRTFFDNAFMPNIRYDQMPGADERVAYAAEFGAYRLGQIDEKLARLIEVMERGSGQSSERKGRQLWQGKLSTPTLLSAVPSVLSKLRCRVDRVCHENFPYCARTVVGGECTIWPICTIHISSRA